MTEKKNTCFDCKFAGQWVGNVVCFYDPRRPKPLMDESILYPCNKFERVDPCRCEVCDCLYNPYLEI